MNELPINRNCDERQARSLVSIVINNYNYARYLAAAIESALAQNYGNLEVVVVDDGSTDESRRIISSYGSCITPVFKSNGGQASALNAGYAASAGEIVLFLDADDVLLPSAIDNISQCFAEPDVSNVRWPMWIVDAAGNRTGDRHPTKLPTALNLRQRLLELGPSNVPSVPTSGNAWSRAFFDRVMPIPEDAFRLCADDYLYNLAPAFGEVKTIKTPQSCYRIHGGNHYISRSFDEKLNIELRGYERLCCALADTLRRNGIDVDPEKWRRHSWFHRLERAVTEIKCILSSCDSLILIDGNEWDATDAFGSRTVRPFVERDGIDWGPPANCESAIEQLQLLRRQGEEHLVIGWPAFWWFDTYPLFAKYLDETSSCVLRNDDVAIFRLGRTTSSPIAMGEAQMISD